MSLLINPPSEWACPPPAPAAPASVKSFVSSADVQLHVFLFFFLAGCSWRDAPPTAVRPVYLRRDDICGTGSFTENYYFIQQYVRNVFVRQICYTNMIKKMTISILKNEEKTAVESVFLSALYYGDVICYSQTRRILLLCIKMYYLW